MSKSGAEYQKHQLNIWPEDQRAIRQIALSMQRFGYLQGNPIVLYEGKILDGWLRYLAAQKARVEPSFTTFEGSRDDAWEYSLSVNTVRKHYTKRDLVEMSLSLRRMVEDPDFYGVGTDEEIAVLSGCSVSYVKQVKVSMAP